MIEGPYPLPSGWRWVRLGEVCKINPRRPRLIRGDGAPTSFVPMRAVDEFLGMIVEIQIRPFAEVRKGYTYFEEGDVLFAKITPCMENGKAAIAKGLIDGIGFGSTEFHVLRPSLEVIAEWVWYFVRQEVFRNKAKESFRGGVGQQRVPQDFLESYLLPLPPLEEQRRIVAKVEALMERVREVRRLRAEAQKDTELLMQTALAEVFPHPGADLPPGWRWVRLGEVCDIIMGQSPPSSTYNFEGNGLPFFQGKADFGDLHPTPRIWCSAPQKVARPGDVLISVRAPVGSTNVANLACCIGRGLAALRPRDSLERFWLLYYLHYLEPELSKMGAGSTFNAITKKDLQNVFIPLPPLEEQRRIVAYLDQIQQQVAALKRAQAETEAELKRLEQAILDKAFRGDL
ncbi:restriction endonuclease subunit S [Caldanaerobacter subterraneus KAk]|uniref:Restriction endonuclease S subunit n=1 Tax=Caldanaerobacter subterraneus subsp. pacificus DSM 12653 TaxID=391606 RepID=A0A0F5PLL6_9THEO|nr:restriction endonuclease subunit S [Caldanaerobacter subterraneus]KKC29500.1 restriction endonuclease S subunit [Caldanaerobacter subterraneus subsp. pacificus DSM 12653]